MNNVNSSGSFRVKKNPFTQVSNSALRDSNLSLKAKGLYSLIQSYITIPDFVLYKSYLISVCREKEKAFNSAWKELKVNGYLKQYRIPKGKNDSFVYEYDLLDIADPTTPPLINLNKNGEEITGQKDENSHTPHFVPYANSTLCESHPMRDGSGINNTDSNNTDSNNIKSKSSQSQTEETQKLDKTMTSDNDIVTQDNFSEMKKELSTNPPARQSKRLNDSSFRNTKYSFLDDYTTCEEIIKENISYKYFLPDKINIALVDNFVACIIDVVLTTDETITINKEKKSRNLVKSIYMKLRYEHILHAINQYKAQHHQITYKHAYIKNVLYNSYHELDAHYMNQVRADNIVW